MSGLVGHTLYAVLAAHAAEQRRLPVAALLKRHQADYLAGAYLGCDIQVMPEAICEDTGREVGFGTVPLTKSPLTGGKVRPWSLEFQGEPYRPRRIHDLFYGRSHLLFGWTAADARLAVPWDHLPDYGALALRDARSQAADPEKTTAYLFGWLVHVVGDSLIKSVQPGIRLRLLDGTYTPRNRPIQDLFAFHVIGRSELRFEWETWFDRMAATPVEPAQLHYMRAGPATGELGKIFAEGWQPDRADLLKAVLRENRRWLRHHARDVLASMELGDGPDGPRLSETVRSVVGDLPYGQLMAMAESAGMRTALRTIADSAVDLFGKVSAAVPSLR